MVTRLTCAPSFCSETTTFFCFRPSASVKYRVASLGPPSVTTGKMASCLNWSGGRTLVPTSSSKAEPSAGAGTGKVRIDTRAAATAMRAGTCMSASWRHQTNEALVGSTGPRRRVPNEVREGKALALDNLADGHRDAFAKHGSRGDERMELP